MMLKYWGLLVMPSLVRCGESFNFSLTSTLEPLWGYKCVPKKGCQRTEKSISGTNSSLYRSLDLCRIVCCEFGGIWPKPVVATISAQTVKIHPAYLRYRFKDVPAEAHAILVKMTRVATANLEAECGGDVTEQVDTPVVVSMFVQSEDISLTWDTVEQYTIHVGIKKGTVAVDIYAETIYGARHGLETFTQLVASVRPGSPNDNRCALRIVSGAKVRDEPAYRHRGLTLDSSRNFIPLKDIKRTLDGMAATKMNVFHWHVTDSHSFPLESSRVPELTRYGAYSKDEIYTTDQVKELVEYARVRGIRVVIEIDAPAHAGNGWQWGKDAGHGDLAVCVNEKNWRHFCIQPPCGQLNPANPAMYDVLKNLYRDIAELLPQPALFHMGGDEVFFGCWNSSDQIVQYMKNKSYNTKRGGFIRLWAEFHARALQIWDEQLREATGVDQQPVMLWSSELTKSLMVRNYLDKKRYVIQVWDSTESKQLARLIHLGYGVVSVPKNIWYLDHGFWSSTKFSNWRKMYVHTLPKEKPGRRVLGGEVAMWSEYVDENELDTRIWPRAAAVGERLWADPTSSAGAAEPRLQRLRARLAARGLRPDAISPEWCSQHGGKCLQPIIRLSAANSSMARRFLLPRRKHSWQQIELK